MNMFGSPKPPAPVAPVVMPTPNSKAITDAQTDELKAAAARSGRASTIMTMPNDISKTDTMGG